MNIIARTTDRVFYSASSPAGGPLPDIDGPFACLLWDHVGASTSADRARLADSLVRSGCRYAVCGGRDCEDWHDAIDEAARSALTEATEEQRVANHVMTTWHVDETKDDVAFFLVTCAMVDEPFERNLVLHVGRADADLDAAVRRHAAGEAG